MDLFDPPKDVDAEVARQPAPNANRIRRNLAFWPPHLVQTMIEKVEPGNLKYVCLFVNKCDLIEKWDTSIEEKIRQQFTEMWKTIRGDLNEAECEFICGSAEKRIGTSDLLSSLIAVSAPPASGNIG